MIFQMSNGQRGDGKATLFLQVAFPDGAMPQSAPVSMLSKIHVATVKLT